MKIYFVRHGKTEWNKLKKMQGSADIPLNEEGIEQADKTKEYEKVLIVAHGGVSRPLDCYFNGMMSDEKLATFIPENAKVMEYEL